MDGRFVDVESIAELLHQSVDRLLPKPQDEIEVMGGSGNAPVVTHHRTGDHEVNAGSIEPA
jgi:hypothetical protein